ncbi:MAG: DsbA family protein [Sneathiellaceae bacterium]
MKVEHRSRRSGLVGALAVLLIAVAGIGAWLLLDPGFRQETPAGEGAVAIGETDFGARVRAYLLEHPEVIVEAMRGLEQRQLAEQERAARQALAAEGEALLQATDDPVGGNPDGDVTLVEFFDYNCPYCRRVAPVMIEAEAADPNLRIVYKELPILGADSEFAAKAALAARRQGRYVDFHKAMMAETGGIDRDTALALAESLGIDIDRLQRDMGDPKLAASIERNMELARKLRITGTPGFVIGEAILRGATDLTTLQARIAAARAPE